ncbi:MAG: hypothetical protein KJ077_10340 [Anaerolineae bacterium]|nr:hypothetical protein [Anaerolineae bacterium]
MDNFAEMIETGVGKTVHLIFRTKTLGWAIYIALLGALLPHTKWAFSRFQDSADPFFGDGMAWLLAVAFEGGIFWFTHRLVDSIERAYRLRTRATDNIWSFYWRRYSRAYLNINLLGLTASSLVSGLANFSYAAEFGQQFGVYDKYGIQPLTYQLFFGGILPFMSLLFSLVLAQIPGEDEGHPTEDTIQAELRRVKSELSQTLAKLTMTEQTVQSARQENRKLTEEMAALKLQLRTNEGLLQFSGLLHENAEERIKAANRLWPNLSQAAKAEIANASPAWVSQVLNQAKVLRELPGQVNGSNGSVAIHQG